MAESYAVQFARKGGNARARMLTDKERQESARTAARARWSQKTVLTDLEFSALIEASKTLGQVWLMAFLSRAGIVREYQRRLSALQQLKRAARYAVRNALRKGSLTRLPCAECGNPRSQAHHADYSEPLLVTWLCRSCHGAERSRSSA